MQANKRLTIGHFHDTIGLNIFYVHLINNMPSWPRSGHKIIFNFSHGQESPSVLRK